MAEAATFLSISRDIRAQRPAAVYLLHGEEGYYIDRLAEMFVEMVPESERDFDLTVLYAPELSSPAAVVAAAKRYPMFGARQVVIVKEVQTAGANFLNAIADYVATPNEATVLVICCRGQQARGADFMKALKSTGKGVNFESKKLTERNVASVVAEFVKEKGLSIDAKALTMLGEFVGTDLSRIYNEIDKLTVTLGKGAMITPEVVERNIGVSKDYNNFELASALANRDAAKALTIWRHFAANPKANPTMVSLVVMYNLFSNLLVALYASDKSDRGLMAELGFRSPYQLRDINAAMRHYSAWDAIEIIGLLRRFDAASKGNGSRQNPYDLMFDLILHILNPLGRKGVNPGALQ